MYLSKPREKEQLSNTEAITSAVLGALNDGVFSIDLDYRITSFNRAAAKLTGWSASEVLGRKCHTIFRSYNCEHCALKETMRSGQAITNGSLIITSARGERIGVNISTASIQDDEGKIVGGVMVFRDSLTSCSRAHVLNEAPGRTRSYKAEMNVLWDNQNEIRACLNTGKSVFFSRAKPEDPLLASCSDLTIGKTGPLSPVTITQEVVKDESQESYWEITTIPLMGHDNRFKGNIEISHNVTKETLAEMALRESEEKYRCLVEELGSNYTFWGLDAEDRFSYLSSGCKNMFGIMPEKGVGKKWSDLVQWEEQSLNQAKQYLHNIDHQKGTEPFEMSFVQNDSQKGVVEVTILPSFDDEDKVRKINGLFLDITDRKNKKSDVHDLGNTDVLTGANNRWRIWEIGREELRRCRRFATPFALLLVDIDNLTSINDSYGHSTGDIVLQKLTETCLAHLRKPDAFGRVGGGKFTALLVEADRDKALAAAKRLCRSMAATPIRKDGVRIPVTVSIGLTCLTPEDTCLELMMQRADKALRKAKKKGKNMAMLL